MRTFKQYLNEVVSIRELYHGTTTGQNNRNIQSFKNGVDPTRAHGYGQGAGFYCFADAQSAQKHAAGLLKPRDDDSTFVTGAELSGLPMVVGVVGKLNPYDWDVDYELNKEKLVRFIYDHYEKFAGMQFQHGGQPHQMNPNKNRVLVGFRVIDGEGNGRGYSGNDSNTDEAVLIKNIIQQFSQHNPEVVNTFKTIFFDNMTPGIAVKYVGSAPLKVTSMQVLNSGAWQRV